MLKNIPKKSIPSHQFSGFPPLHSSLKNLSLNKSPHDWAGTHLKAFGAPTRFTLTKVSKTTPQGCRTAQQLLTSPRFRRHLTARRLPQASAVPAVAGPYGGAPPRRVANHRPRAPVSSHVLTCTRPNRTGCRRCEVQMSRPQVRTRSMKGTIGLARSTSGRCSGGIQSPRGAQSRYLEVS